ncbi:MAG TPA: VOC family protein, partial [Polyangiaceae bacterium]|nr:VOC family protein [Polyangiaceae bacterium]
MSSSMFCRYDLRTTDPDAARRFYRDVLGWELVVGESQAAPPPIAVWLLHEQARARGAPAHWLGAIGVTDVEASVRRLLELGSERLGPTVQARDGSTYATLRDPGGAVVALRSSGEKPRSAAVAWHQLHTRDVERSWSVYSGLFGWKHTQTVDV